MSHHEDARRRFEADGQIPMPFVGRAAGAQAIAEFAAKKGGRRADSEVGAREQARFPCPACIAGLGAGGTIIGAWHRRLREGSPTRSAPVKTSATPPLQPRAACWS